MTRKEYSKLRNAFTTEAELNSCILENASISPDCSEIYASVQLNCTDIGGIQDFLSENSVFVIPSSVYTDAHGRLPVKLRLRMDTKAEDGLSQTAIYDLLIYKGTDYAVYEPIITGNFDPGVKAASFFIFAKAYTLLAPIREVKVKESKTFAQKVKDAIVAEQEVGKFVAAAVENIHGEGETSYSVRTKTENGVTEVWVESGDKKFYRKFDNSGKMLSNVGADAGADAEVNTTQTASQDEPPSTSGRWSTTTTMPAKPSGEDALEKSFRDISSGLEKLQERITTKISEQKAPPAAISQELLDNLRKLSDTVRNLFDMR